MEYTHSITKGHFLALFSSTNKRDYIEWITEAKTEATRVKRLTQAIECMADGKPRNWKYMPAYR